MTTHQTRTYTQRYRALAGQHDLPVFVIEDENGAVVYEVFPAGNTPQLINAQTGTSYTFVYADGGKLVTSNNAGANQFIVPTNANVPYPLGTHIDMTQLGAGQLTIAASGGVTVHNATGLKAAFQYSGLTLVKVDFDVWSLFGETSA